MYKPVKRKTDFSRKMKVSEISIGSLWKGGRGSTYLNILLTSLYKTYF